MIQTKSYKADVKAYDAAQGTFEAIVSVFGNVDYGNDRVMPGAFTKTLADWNAKGDPIPVIWSHEWNDPSSHIGIVTQAEERETGLWVKAQLDVEANEKAAYVARLLKQRRITQFSFGFYVTNSNLVDDKDAGTMVREITEIDLFEVGPTLLGMNPETVLLEAASRTIEDAKAGRVLSSKNEDALTQARDLLNEVLAQLETDNRTETVQGSKSLDIEIKADAPDWMRNNAEQGLAWYADGLAGDGVVEATIREAREIASGNVTDAKARKMAAWFARHMVDLDAPAADPENEDYPSPGVVAHALWGGGTRQKSERALAWAERRVEQLNGEKSATDQATEEAQADPEADTRDSAPNIDNELHLLLARPRNKE